MRAELLVLLASCATHDALHSEPLVARAACKTSHLGVFGYPYDQEACGAQITNLGDGCYRVIQPPGEVPLLYECAADTPDGHVACVHDARDTDGPFVFGAPPFTQTLARSPDGRPFERAVGRCRARHHAWRIAHGERWPRVDLTIGEIRAAGVVLAAPSTIHTDEDAASMSRILHGRDRLLGTACAGAVTFDDLPARFAHALAAAVATKLADLSPDLPPGCQRISVELTDPHRVAGHWQER